MIYCQVRDGVSFSTTKTLFNNQVIEDKNPDIREFNKCIFLIRYGDKDGLQLMI